MMWLNKIMRSGAMCGLVIININGLPKLEIKEKGKSIAIKKYAVAQSFIQDLRIKTSAQEFLVLNANDQYEITVLPGSNVLVTSAMISLADGKVYIKSLSKTDKKYVLSTEFFQQDLSVKNVSLQVEVDMKKALLDVCNLGDEYKLALYDDLNPQLLKSKEGVQFQGVHTPEKRIAYDILLEKRKAPKGQWLEKKSCSLKAVEEIQNAAKIKKEKQAKLAQEKQQKAVALKQKNDSQFLCLEPYANLGQCRFILRQENDAEKCYRERCNAEGKWAETAEVSLTKNQCSLEGTINDCGY